ncbi:MAG: UDP-N-acetylmuramoyl-tripeptide--D-alanyl-D-alanine ligase [Actinobacteria bacterium]|nr:UDP-N-acetylmuramoyl-tripeptide--D-alanyl-D-alanine ligase [Actinomycetota bacterium]
MRFSTSELAEATGGDVFGRPAEVDGVAIDSRLVEPGQLFVPLVAERDGHDFIGAAIAAGARVYLTSGPIEAATAILVEDTAAALTDLGAHARDRLSGAVVGVTGSVGKTSLKDLLAAVGATTWRTSASRGSFNNELGVPLTLANAPDDTELAVVEMGARGRGHVALLCDVARPTVGIVTVVAGAHLEQFGSLDEVAVAKSELVAALPAEGFAVLNADDHRVAAMAGVTPATVVTFGVAGGEVRAEDVVLDANLRARFALRSPWGDAEVHLGVAGAHQVVNALGAAAAALALGAEPEAVAAGLGDGRLSAMRMDLQTRADGLRVLDDTYNANPTSMVAALDALAALDLGGNGRRLAVLGSMNELGADAEAAHRDVATAAVERGIAVVAVAEPRYGTDGVTLVDDVDAAARWVAEQGLGKGDAVLVKASRSARLERLVTRLRAG